MKYCYLILIFYAYVVSDIYCQTGFFTKPELTQFDSTSSSNDVHSFLQYIADRDPNAFLDTIFTTLEGRHGLCIRFFNTSQSIDNQRLVVYMQGNIHGGEVEGKEALLMLSRELSSGPLRYLTDRLNILLVPNFNPDGNDQFDENHRPSQEHCPHFVGKRRSGQDLDLNRDGVKMEGEETKGLFRNVITKFKPMVFVDMHTTNGTWHANHLTFAHTYHTAGSGITSNFTRDSMLPHIQKKMQTNHGIRTNFYGNFYLQEGWPLTNYYTYNHHPRYLVNQFDMRNAIAILSETFAHDKFYTRIRSAYHFAKEILVYCYQKHQTLLKLCEQSKKTTQNILSLTTNPIRGVQYKMIPREKPIRLKTYDYTPYLTKDSTIRYYRSPLQVWHDSIQIHDQFKATKTSIFPSYYIFSKKLTNIISILSDHGIEMDTLEKNTTINLDVFIIDSFSVSSYVFENHNFVTIDGQYRSKKMSCQKGDIIVRTDQELGFLAFYLLEPQSDDGLVKWNFFDAYFHDRGIEKKQIQYPIFKQLIHTDSK